MIDETRVRASRPSGGARFARPARAHARSNLASVIALAAAALVLAVFGLAPMFERLEHRARTAEQQSAPAQARPGG